MHEIIALVLTLFLILLTSAYARRFGIAKEISIAGLRAFSQILILASVILMLLNLPLYYSFVVLLIMIMVAGHTTYSRSGRIQKGLPIAIASIATVSMLMLIPFFLLKIFPFSARYLIPTGSILIGNAMNVSSLAIDRYRGEVKNRKAEIEAYLALGASPRLATSSCLRQGILSALIPSIDNMKNLGMVWIPGVMTGMLLSGAHPIEAASIQIVIFTSIFTTNMMACNLMLYFSINSFFTQAWQLRDLD